MHPGLVPSFYPPRRLWSCENPKCNFIDGDSHCKIFLQSTAYMESLFAFRECLFAEVTG